LWLEEGVDPALAMRQMLVHFVARAGLALVFVYQGLVPKLLAAHRDEVAMLLDSGVAADNLDVVLTMLGLAEVGFALALLIFWHRRWPSWLCLGLMFVAVVAVAVNSPQFLDAAFNPVSLNLAVASLAAVDLLVLGRLPSATRCQRKPPLEAT
jgi:uncharacterized membrane protein YphA (DoxX/SURF4 family)